MSKCEISPLFHCTVARGCANSTRIEPRAVRARAGTNEPPRALAPWDDRAIQHRNEGSRPERAYGTHGTRGVMADVVSQPSMSGLTLSLHFLPSSPALRFMQQYPREQAEVVAHCALLYGVRCLSVQASTSGALSFEQLKRLSGHVDTVSVGCDSPESDILEADDVKTHADLGEIGGDTNKTDTTASSPPRVSRATRVAASAAIRGAAQAWEVEADAVGRGLRQRRVQPPPRPRAPQQCDSDTDDGSTAAMHQQLHALETELADLKASINTHPDVDHASSAAKGQLLHLSSTVDGHEHDWHSESPSDRDSVVVGVDIPVAVSRQNYRQQPQRVPSLKSRRNGSKINNTSTHPAGGGSKSKVKRRQGRSGTGHQEMPTTAGRSTHRARGGSISAVTARILADRERSKHQRQHEHDGWLQDGDEEDGCNYASEEHNTDAGHLGGDEHDEQMPIDKSHCNKTSSGSNRNYRHQVRNPTADGHPLKPWVNSLRKSFGTGGERQTASRTTASSARIRGEPLSTMRKRWSSVPSRVREDVQKDRQKWLEQQARGESKRTMMEDVVVESSDVVDEEIVQQQCQPQTRTEMVDQLVDDRLSRYFDDAETMQTVSGPLDRHLDMQASSYYKPKSPPEWRAKSTANIADDTQSPPDSQQVDERSWDSLPSTAPTETEPGLGMAEFEARERAALSSAARQDEEEANT